MTVIAVLPTPNDCSSSLDHATLKNSLENDKLNNKLFSLDRLSHKQAVKLHGDIFELRKEVYQRKKNALPLALRYTRHFDHSLSDFGSVCSASSSEYSLTTSVQGSPSTYRRSLASISLDLSSDWDDTNSSCSQSETCSSTDSMDSSLRRRASRMEAAERAEDKRLENLHRRYTSQLKTRINGSVSRGCRVRLSPNV